MSRIRTFAFVLAATVFAQTACGVAHADHARRHGPGPITIEPDRQVAPWRVDLLDEAGRPLPTFRHRGRFYVLGQVGERYTIRVTNPTPRRVEAVISVDGLDVIDGRTADFVSKRGYVVPAYGELRVDGFRVSAEEVAAFRFSSVRDSYAGRKGQDRHVGVVGVAIFTEREEPPVYLPEAGPTPMPFPQERRSGGGQDRDERDQGRMGRSVGGGRASAGVRAPSKSAEATSSAPSADGGTSYDRYEGAPTPSERPGLGTEFGERRGSRVTFTRFERENPTRPIAIAELRYNDYDGLTALGIRIPPPWNEDLDLRETANPFPGSGYASPPPGWR